MTKEIPKMSSIAKKFGGAASHLITPKHWLNKKIWLLTDEEYRDLVGRNRKDGN